jgi:DNA-binding response OmpR family regulator
LRDTKGRVCVLLVEDNEGLCSSLVRGIRESGFEVDVARTGGSAVERLHRNDCDAVILDLGLPDIDGLEVLTTVRASGVVAPILVLTARDAVGARVAALDRGADDYLIKPFAFDELIARLRALLRRASAPRWGPLAFGDLRVDAQNPIVWVGPRTVALSPREQAILYRLVRHGRDITSRREILAEVFGYDFDPGTNVVEVHIAHLRRKLEGASASIETVRGAGYRLRLASEQDHAGSA